MTSCSVNVGKSLFTVPLSFSPLRKKKLAPRSCCFLRWLITVWEMVDFPIPAMLFNQNMYFLCDDFAQSSIS